MIGVSARPFSKSFSSHVQQLGRVMRPHEGKDQAVWFDHSGNYLRFKKAWDELCANGVDELDDGAEKPKPEPTEQEKEAAKVSSLRPFVAGQSDTCAHCGFKRERKSAVIEVAGEMFELATAKKAEQYSMEYKTAFMLSCWGMQ